MRKAKPRKRIILPDPKYNDVLVTKFVNNLMGVEKGFGQHHSFGRG